MAQLRNLAGWVGAALVVACGGSTNKPSAATLSTGGNGIGGSAPGSGGGGTLTSPGSGGTGGQVTTANGGVKSIGGSSGQSTGGTQPITSTGGIGSGGSSDSASGGSGGSTHSCDGSACCQPLVLDNHTTWATIAGDRLSITILVTRSGGSDPYWDVQADVAVPGGQATCKPSMQTSYTTYLGIECPAIILDPAPICGSTLALQIHLRSSTYPAYNSIDATCAAAGTMDIELQQPVTCPSCPASLIPPSNEPCEIPGSDCPAQGFSFTCPCNLDRKTGERKWTCPTP
jgi:hypothetical protein